MAKLTLKIEKRTEWRIVLRSRHLAIFGFYTNGKSKIKSKEYQLITRLKKYDHC